MISEHSAGIVLFKEDKQREYLLLEYSPDHWDFSKGNVEKGETEIEAATRELKEETGIDDVKIIEGLKESISYFFRRGGNTINKTVTFFLGKTEKKEVKISWEHKGFIWLNFNDALQKITFNNSKQILRNAEEFLNKLDKQNLKKFLK